MRASRRNCAHSGLTESSFARATVAGMAPRAVATKKFMPAGPEREGAQGGETEIEFPGLCRQGVRLFTAKVLLPKHAGHSCEELSQHACS